MRWSAWIAIAVGVGCGPPGPGGDAAGGDAAGGDAAGSDAAGGDAAGSDTAASDLAVDGAFDAAREFDMCGLSSCAGKPGINGPSDCAADEVGQTFTCSTWEFDYCCVCVPVDSHHSWVCFGGFTHGDSADGRSCGGCSAPKVFACLGYGPGASGCCSCEMGDGGQTWRCGDCLGGALDGGSCG